MGSIVLLLCVCLFGLAAAAARLYAIEDAQQHFDEFIKKYERKYADQREHQSRFQIFKENLEIINRLNEKSKNAVYGITQFSDLSSEEFEKKHNCFKHESFTTDDHCTLVSDADIVGNDAPESFDWREHNAVTPVKDQGGCGSCYAFGTIGNVEGQYAIKHNQLTELSEQQIVDCDDTNDGCSGGIMSRVMKYLIKVGGIEASADYSYTGEEGTCKFDVGKALVRLSDCRSYNLTSQEKLKQLLYKTGPITIGVQGKGVQHYNKGIILDEVCDEGFLSHAVLLVGYGSENGDPYWVVKNSWGTGWGEDGYFRTQRGETALSCGLMNDYMTSAIVA